MGEFSHRRSAAMPFSGNFGVRYVRTDPAARPAIATVGAIGPVATTVDRDYNDTLPSFNLVAEITPDFLIRFGAAKVMSRPGLGSLTPGATVTVTGGARTVSGGNPDLDPIRATNVDLGFEWYFHEGAMLGVGLFYKDIESFVQTTRETAPVLHSGLPASPARRHRRRVPTDDFTFTMPVNTPGGKLKGVEAQLHPAVHLPAGQVVSNFGVPVQLHLGRLARSSTSASNGTPSAEDRPDRPVAERPGTPRCSTKARFLRPCLGDQPRRLPDHGTGPQRQQRRRDPRHDHDRRLDRYKINEQLELASKASTSPTNSATSGSIRAVIARVQYTETGRQFLLGVRYKF